MAVNPFANITDLQGQEFVDAEFIETLVFEGGPTNLPLNPNSGSYTDFFKVGNLGVINVVSDEFTAGFNGTVGNSDYYFPTFGAIQFSNITDGVNPVTFYVHGFTTNGLFITKSPVTYLDSSTYHWNSDAYFKPYFLGFYGVSAYDPTTTTVGAGGDVFGTDPSVLVTSLCFAEGTRLETEQGLVAVEDLVVGTKVRTAGGERRPIKWIGHMNSHPARHPRPWEANPVRVTAHAFGPNRPARDVRLSPGHAVHVNGVLVPVGHLVNGATIIQEDVEHIRYFHVELDSHDILLAEGLPCESYFDDGNRAAFTNADVVTGLHGRLDPMSWDHACAPLVAEGVQLTEIREQLRARAELLGWQQTEEADLVIEADGKIISPLDRAENRYRFAVPAAASLALKSNRGVLAHMMPNLSDGRQLGVAIADVRIDGASVDLDDGLFGQGFYPAERHEQLGWRWTDGAAELKVESDGPAMIELSIIMVAPSWKAPSSPLLVAA